MLLLFGLALVLGALTLGAFAALGSGAPLWLRSLGSVEHSLSQQLGTGEWPDFTRALVLAVLTSAVVGLAAYVKPRD
ncbi:hypothetical protein [Deinococcus aerophilus]|uniref:Uncharacterized protein n=1 Tax=Deinococcus aerophilus TaxID=522488 RepID=A0ABQ2GKL0_9DEIO|nr:hypothetical protein [Deinococcus aerophilus]GGM00128.1 hypothetical protein GCM10010841_05870 [Deinococcus aerophilus]